jgi:ribosome maturation factor RimP
VGCAPTFLFLLLFCRVTVQAGDVVFGFWKVRLSESTRIEELIGPSIAAMGYRIVRVSFGGGGKPILQVMAEPLDGRAMTIEDCEQVSRSISAILDVEDPIPSHYQLEVSSPGIDRPLVARDDYRRFAGFEARIELYRPCDGRKRFRGRITPVDEGDQVTVLEESGKFAIPFADIAKAKLILNDELIAATAASQVPPPAPQPNP